MKINIVVSVGRCCFVRDVVSDARRKPQASAQSCCGRPEFAQPSDEVEWRWCPREGG